MLLPRNCVMYSYPPLGTKRSTPSPWSKLNRHSSTLNRREHAHAWVRISTRLPERFSWSTTLPYRKDGLALVRVLPVKSTLENHHIRGSKALFKA